MTNETPVSEKPATLDAAEVATLLRAMIRPLPTARDAYYVGACDAQNHANNRALAALQQLSLDA